MIDDSICSTYVALDLEMTGLNPKEDCIIEIGAVRVEKGEQTQNYSAFVQPAKQLSERVSALTGITGKDLEQAIEPEQAIPEILRFIGELPLLGHGIFYDFSFLKRAAVNLGFAFEHEGIDTLRLARCFLPELPSKKLEDLMQHYQIRYQPHRALEDARAASVLYERLREQFGTEENAALFKPVRLLYKIKREGPATVHQKQRLKELIALHQISPDYCVEKLTRNQASRYIDKILAQYGREFTKS